MPHRVVAGNARSRRHASAPIDPVPRQTRRVADPSVSAFRDEALAAERDAEGGSVEAVVEQAVRTQPQHRELVLVVVAVGHAGGGQHVAMPGDRVELIVQIAFR